VTEHLCEVIIEQSPPGPVTANRASWSVVHEHGGQEADKRVEAGCYAEILAVRCRYGYDGPPRSPRVSPSGSGVRL